MVDNEDLFVEATPFLGIARIPTFRVKDFLDALCTLLEPVGKAEQFSSTPRDAGGESYSEIKALFADEDVAAEVLKKVNGAMCFGRKLQMAFAQEF